MSENDLYCANYSLDENNINESLVLSLFKFWSTIELMVHIAFCVSTLFKMDMHRYLSWLELLLCLLSYVSYQNVPTQFDLEERSW